MEGGAILWMQQMENVLLMSSYNISSTIWWYTHVFTSASSFKSRNEQLLSIFCQQHIRSRLCAIQHRRSLRDFSVILFICMPIRIALGNKNILKGFNCENSAISDAIHSMHKCNTVIVIVNVVQWGSYQMAGRDEGVQVKPNYNSLFSHQ